MQRDLQALKDAVRLADDERRMREVADYARHNGFTGTATAMDAGIESMFGPARAQEHEGVLARSGEEER